MAVVRSHCFYPDGSVADQDTQCFPNENTPSCCRIGWTCLANGLCLDPNSAQLARGTCTDRAWVSPLCPQFCTKNEYDGGNARDFAIEGVPTWGCSDKWPGEGGLMCCEISKVFNPEFNGSCCPGSNAYNLFSIGSKLGSAKSITLSSSSSLETLVSPLPQLSLSNEIIYLDGSSFALIGTNAPSTPHSTTSSLNTSPSPSLSLSPGFISSSKTNPATTLASGHSGAKGSTVPIAVGTSIGAVVLMIMASIWIYRCLGKNGRKTPRSRLEEPINQVVEHGEPQEISGHRDHELPSSARYFTQELPQLENQCHNPQELSGRYICEL